MGMKLYSVYVRKHAPNPLESALFVKQGFNFWAFLLTPVWSLYKRLWIVSAVLIAVSVLLAHSDSIAFNLISVVFSIWFGMEANNFLTMKLERKNYILFDVVGARDKYSAEQRFYDKYQSFKNTPRANFA